MIPSSREVLAAASAEDEPMTWAAKVWLLFENHDGRFPSALANQPGSSTYAPLLLLWLASIGSHRHVTGADEICYRCLVTPCSVSVRTMSVQATVIGGVQSGWKTATNVKENSALPFCTGKSPSAEKLPLLTAFGWWPPLLMHKAVAVTTMCTCVSLPR